MSKRVHEIAKELGLNSKEVIGRLNEAGIEVNHHSATIEDPDFERVFGDGAGSTNGASNGRATSAPETAATETATVTEAPQPAAAPADSQQSAPQAGAGGRRGGGKKRRRVVRAPPTAVRAARRRVRPARRHRLARSPGARPTGPFA
jgi:translation initiation factor IF-2